MKANAHTQQATARLESLKQRTKRNVFDIFCSVTLGRVHCATIGEQRKSWMIYDIIRAEFGEATAEAVYPTA